MRNVVEWKEKEDKISMIVVIVECLDKNIKKNNIQVQKLDEVEKKWHVENKQFVVLKEVIKTWKTKHEESLIKYTMVKTLNQVKNIVQGYIFNDFP